MHARGDFGVSPRLLLLSCVACVIGAFGVAAAFCLTSLIGLFTNLFYFHRLAWELQSPAQARLGWDGIFIPVLGGVCVGCLARFGSEKIRGHGIPEALEAILFGKSIMSWKVALLKPLSSALSIGSGGPFGAEGPIIMTGGS